MRLGKYNIRMIIVVKGKFFEIGKLEGLTLGTSALQIVTVWGVNMLVNTNFGGRNLQRYYSGTKQSTSNCWKILILYLFISLKAVIIST